MRLVKGLHHVSLSVRPEDYERSVRFYRDFLELPYAHLSEGNTLLDFGNAVLEIFPNGDNYNASGALNHFAILTDEPDTLLEKVRAAGYEIVQELIDFAPPMKDEEHYPLRFGFFKGPTGELIEVFCEKPVKEK